MTEEASYTPKSSTQAHMGRSCSSAVNREWAQSVIGEMLEDDKGQFEKKCRGCGVVLPWDYDYPICQECYHSGVKDDRVRRSMHRYPHDRSRR